MTYSSTGVILQLGQHRISPLPPAIIFVRFYATVWCLHIIWDRPQYALQGGSFQTPEFEQLIQYFIDIYSSGAISSTFGSTLIENHSSDSDFMSLSEESSFMLLPVLDANDPGYEGLYYSYSLLNNAPHKQAALDFLGSALTPEVQNVFVQTCDIFAKAMPQYRVEKPDFTCYGAFAPDKNGEMTYTVDSTDGYIIYPVIDEGVEIKPEDFENYVFMREHLLPNTGHWYELSILWFEIIPQAIDGNMPLSEISLALDNRMAMMQKE